MTDMREVAAPVRCRKPKHRLQHPLECPCAKAMLAEHPNVTEPIYLGTLNGGRPVYLAKRGPA